jgi:outer membrane lipoprotein-sorting protein
MVQVPRLSRRARWAVPAGALVITGGVIAGSLISVAQAAPGLPARTPAQLLAEVADSATPPLTGTVVETASFGLPALPATGNPTSLSSLLTGSHTIRVWYSSPGHFRLAVPESLSESDVIADGGTAWLWQSTLNKVTKFTLPAPSAKPQPSQAQPNQTLPDQTLPKQPLTPQQAAQQVLAAVGPTTTVSVASNVTVAGQAAYGLVLAPKDARSLVGQVQIDVDGRNGVPLRLQVFARGASSPAFGVGYTAIQFVTPAPADLSFTPPPGSTVTQVNLADTGGGGAKANAGSGVATIGSGWLTVLKLPSSALTAGAPAPGSGSSTGPGGASSAGDSSAVLNALLASATPVHGAWGTGRLLRTSLVSVLMTDQGSTFVGAVEPSVLYAAAASGASAQQPAGTP